MAIPLSEKTRRRLEALFARSDRPLAEALLVKECADNLPCVEHATPSSLERVRFAALKMSNGDLGKLAGAVALAKVDWRDLLMGAGFADLRAHEAWRPASKTEDGEPGSG